MLVAPFQALKRQKKVSFSYILDTAMTFVVSLQLDKICFVENENIKTELKHLHKKGKSLWCVGQSPKSRESPIACIDSDSDEK